MQSKLIATIFIMFPYIDYVWSLLVNLPWAYKSSTTLALDLILIDSIDVSALYFTSITNITLYIQSLRSKGMFQLMLWDGIEFNGLDQSYFHCLDFKIKDGKNGI